MFMLEVWRGENLGVGDSEGERERRGERGGNPLAQEGELWGINPPFSSSNVLCCKSGFKAW